MKLRPEIVEFIRDSAAGPGLLVEQIADRFGVRLHRRTIERARLMSVRSFWPPVEAAQVDYEALRAHLLSHGRLPDDLAAARFARRGLAGLISWPASDPIFVGELAGAAARRGPPTPTRGSASWPRATSSCLRPRRPCSGTDHEGAR